MNTFSDKIISNEAVPQITLATVAITNLKKTSREDRGVERPLGPLFHGAVRVASANHRGQGGQGVVSPMQMSRGGLNRSGLFSFKKKKEFFSKEIFGAYI